MKTINIMNFVRQNDHRLPAHSDILYRTTEAELALVNAYEVENTFLLQYDAFCDERFVKLFREKATPHTELGVWYEIVEPLTSACRIAAKKAGSGIGISFRAFPWRIRRKSVNA